MHIPFPNKVILFFSNEADFQSAKKQLSQHIPNNFWKGLEDSHHLHPERICAQDLLEKTSFLGDTGDLSVSVRRGTLPHVEIAIDNNSKALFCDDLEREKLFIESLAKTTPSLLVSFPNQKSEARRYTGRRGLVYWYCRVLKHPKLRNVFTFPDARESELSPNVYKRIEDLFSATNENQLVSIDEEPGNDSKLEELLRDGDQRLSSSSDPNLAACWNRLNTEK